MKNERAQMLENQNDQRQGSSGKKTNGSINKNILTKKG
jgi:hypothetical protein